MITSTWIYPVLDILERTKDRESENSVDVRINGVELLGAVDGVLLGPLDDFLGVVQQEHAEENQSTVDTYGVEASSHGCCGGQEHASWSTGKKNKYITLLDFMPKKECSTNKWARSV